MDPSTFKFFIVKDPVPLPLIIKFPSVQILFPPSTVTSVSGISKTTFPCTKSFAKFIMSPLLASVTAVCNSSAVLTSLVSAKDIFVNIIMNIMPTSKMILFLLLMTSDKIYPSLIKPILDYIYLLIDKIIFIRLHMLKCNPYYYCKNCK